MKTPEMNRHSTAAASRSSMAATTFPVFDIKGDPRRADLSVPMAIEPLDQQDPILEFSAFVGSVGATSSIVLQKPWIAYASLLLSFISYARKRAWGSSVIQPHRAVIISVLAVFSSYLMPEW